MSEGNLHREENTSERWLASVILTPPSLSKSETWVEFLDELKANVWKFIGANPGFEAGLRGLHKNGIGNPFVFY
ncbi:MAG: hypothetical protein ABSE53_04075 [Terracidiphilus sp.]|jgi:hypothetical protein